MIQKKLDETQNDKVSSLAREIAPVPLTAEQVQAAKDWAADDRLWTTQETVEFNLRTFARVILRAALTGSPEPPQSEKQSLAWRLRNWEGEYHYPSGLLDEAAAALERLEAEVLTLTTALQEAQRKKET